MTDVDYEKVLADLRARKASIDAAISAIEDLKLLSRRHEYVDCPNGSGCPNCIGYVQPSSAGEKP